MYSETSTDNPVALTVPDHLPEAISDVDNVALMETPSEEDVKWAVFFINKDKSPRPHGFNARFFRSLWVEIKEDVMRFGNEFFDNNFLEARP